MKDQVSRQWMCLRAALTLFLVMGTLILYGLSGISWIAWADVDGMDTKSDSEQLDSTPAFPQSAVERNVGPAEIMDKALGFSTRDYVIGPEDLLEVRVFGLEELSQVFRVAEDGMITFPLLGRVKAAGLGKSDFEDEIEHLLAERFVKDPDVTVFIQEYSSKRIALQGAVRRAGVFKVKGPRSLLEMISEAGGITDSAGKTLYILRRDEMGKVNRIEVDLDGLYYEVNPELNLAVQPGDVITIPEERMVSVFVDGAVKSPGRLEIKRSSPLTLLQAITASGGLTDRASEKGVEVVRRGPEGQTIRIHVNLKKIRSGKLPDFELQEGDIIQVAETFF